MDGSLFFSVGEPSGDLHASNLIDQLRLLDPSLSFRGLGGARMAASGCAIDYELTQLAVVGMVEVLPKLREFFRVADMAESIFNRERPDAVVLFDFPGFNMHIAKRAQSVVAVTSGSSGGKAAAAHSGSTVSSRPTASTPVSRA